MTSLCSKGRPTYSCWWAGTVVRRYRGYHGDVHSDSDGVPELAEDLDDLGRLTDNGDHLMNSGN